MSRPICAAALVPPQSPPQHRLRVRRERWRERTNGAGNKTGESTFELRGRKEGRREESFPSAGKQGESIPFLPSPLSLIRGKGKEGISPRGL